MDLLPAGALLPDTIEPYLGLMVLGFVVAMWGHGMHSRWVVAIGIIMVFLAVLLFPLALQIFSEEPPPPGPTVPQAVLF